MHRGSMRASITHLPPRITSVGATTATVHWNRRDRRSNKQFGQPIVRERDPGCPPSNEGECDRYAA